MSDDFTNSSQRLGLLLHFSSVDDFQSALNTLLYLPIHLWNLYRTSVCSTLSITHTPFTICYNLLHLVYHGHSPNFSAASSLLSSSAVSETNVSNVSETISPTSCFKKNNMVRPHASMMISSRYRWEDIWVESHSAVNNSVWSLHVFFHFSFPPG